MLLAIMLQAAAPAPAAPPPERFSILVPVSPQPCPPRSEKPAEGDDVVVCATDLPAQALPYPQEYVYPGPRPSNPYANGEGALAAQGTPCAAAQGGCQVGFGQPLVAAAVGALVGAVKDATAKKPDKRGRVPIDISEPAKKR